MKKIALLLVLAVAACRPIKTEPDILVDEATDGYYDTEGYDYTPYEGSEGDYGYDYSMTEDVPKVYHGSEPILTDLINTKLEVSFDWTKSQMKGKETLTAKPHFYATDSLILDAKGMDINVVTIAGKSLAYSYADDVLRIKLDKKYTKTDSYTVVIDYLAKPDERLTGGSDAIKSDKGLYFINPLKTDPTKMPQIWTQGETEASSVWFPTVDQPNIKTKMEIYITVDAKYTTLSNGKLLSSTKNANGTRTDYWKQELPHAPYLFMMGIGEFKVVKDTYKRPDGKLMEVNYYVEPEWETSAKAIFGETPKMIGYFSKLLGVEYPWDKYAQIVVRDYVSGAMENTSATVFGDFVYKTQRELLDDNDNSTIAHELFHHWFGDLVTAESWSNLTLNESFANYSQYLWDEHRYGKDEADLQAETEADGYFSSGEGGGFHNLVWFDYDDKEDMFDGHSYNKGGRILHMLRSYVGDEAFFAGLQLYLKTNSFKAAEYNQLRLAMEEVTGEDLNWFFNEWYLNKGHFDLSVSYGVSDGTSTGEYGEEEGDGQQKVVVSVSQNAFEYDHYFTMPVYISVYDDRGITTERHWIKESASTIIEIPTVGTVKNVIFDTQDMLLGNITEYKDAPWWIYQYAAENRFAQRRDALTNGASDSEESQAMIIRALNDKFWKIRSTAIGLTNNLNTVNTDKAIDVLKNLVKTDSMAAVRVDALNALSEEDVKGILEDRMTNDPAYSVVSTALTLLSKIDPKSAIKKAELLEKEPSSKMLVGIASLYADNTGMEKFDFYQNTLKGGKLQGYDKLNVLGAFTYFMTKQDLRNQMKAIPVFENEVKNGGFYSQQLLPRCFEYMKAKFEADKTAANEKLEAAVSSGNTNQQNILKGDISELDQLIAEYNKLAASMSEMEEESEH